MTPGPMTQTDMNWFSVLDHHATRSPDRAITVFEGEATTYGEMARRATALAAGLAGRDVGRGDVVALLSYNCPEFLETVFAANYLGAVVMPINWRLAAPEVRYILEHSQARALVCDPLLADLANDATKGMEATLVRGVQRSGAGGRMDDPRRTAGHRGHGGLCAGRGRRCSPVDVHLGHHGTAQGRHDHPCQPGLEEPRAHHRVRLLGRRPRARLRAPLPCGRARPYDDLADRCGSDDHHPPHVRSAGGGRGARALAGDHRLAGARHGQCHHGVARYRAARPLVGPRGHQRRREDAGPPHRATTAHVPVGVVRRCVRTHGDRFR